MLIVRNKTEKIKMASYLEAATERLLDLASLRDHKNMLLSEFLNEKEQLLANLSFSSSIFLNFAKGMICNYYKSFVVVVSPLTSLISE